MKKYATTILLLLVASLIVVGCTRTPYTSSDSQNYGGNNNPNSVQTGSASDTNPQAASGTDTIGDLSSDNSTTDNPDMGTLDNTTVSDGVPQ